MESLRPSDLKAIRFLPVAFVMLSGCLTNLLPPPVQRSVERTSFPRPPVLSTPIEPAPLNLCPVQTTSASGAETALAVTVTDASGAAIKDLRPGDFLVYFQGLRLKIDRVTDSGTQPTSIVVVVDSSLSMNLRLEEVQRGLNGFLNSLSACDEVALIAIGGSGLQSDATVTVIQPFTTDKALAATRLQELEAWGRPALYDATSQGISLLDKAHYPSRALLILGAGMESGSTIEKDQILHDLRKDGFRFYAVGIGDPNASKSPSVFVGTLAALPGGAVKAVNADRLKEMAGAAGGYAFIVPSTSQDGGKALFDVVSKIAGAIGHTYVIEVAVPKSGSQLTGLPNVSVPSHPDAFIHVYSLQTAANP